MMISDSITDATIQAADYMRGVMDIIRPGWEEDDSTKNTPMRFAKYLMEFNQPIDMEKIFGSQFDVEPTVENQKQKYSSDIDVLVRRHGIITQDFIPFTMICEHHLLPAHGRAAIAYIPGVRS